MSRKKRRAKLNAIKDTRRVHPAHLAPQFGEVLRAALAESNVEANDPRVAVDPLTIRTARLFWYPTVISDEVPELALRAEHIRTVVAERTFWDKIVILHGLKYLYIHLLMKTKQRTSVQPVVRLPYGCANVREPHP
jgi:hypothetical protein